MNLSEFITNNEKTILVDGAMGTQLAVAGVQMGGPANISDPDAVAAVHKKYSDVNVDLIITNTLTMNRVYIETHKLGLDVREVNLTGVRLAKNAAREGVYVLGDIGSTGKLLKPYGPLAEEEACETYKEQVSLLAEGGVDGFIIETMIDLKEALCALKACKEVSDLPAIVSMSFETIREDDMFTIVGNSSRECAKVLTEAGVCAVGTNCGSLDPYHIAHVIANMKEVTLLPLIAQPNAGSPHVVDGQDVWDMGPEAFAPGVQECINAGAKIVGGCCGTSPAHIQAVANLLGK